MEKLDNNKNNKKIFMIIAIILIVILIGGIIFLKFNSGKDIKDTDNKLDYSNIEDVIAKKAIEFVDNDVLEGPTTETVTIVGINGLISLGMDDPFEEDNCNGYVIIGFDGNEYSANTYLSCDDYTTNGYDGSYIGE